MIIPRQRLILFAALIATLLATYWVSQQENNDRVDALARPHQSKNALRPGKPGEPLPQHATLSVPQRPEESGTVLDLFDAKFWNAKPASTEPPKPTAPPLPFTYMGKVLENGGTRLFLVQGDRIHIVKAGDTIDSTYRMDKVENGVLTLTYLPLNIQQTLNIGEAQ